MVSTAVIAVIAVFGGYALLCVLSWAYTALTAPGFDVADKHVFITGGSSGLGLALAKQYARAGAKVTIVARRGENLTAAKREIESAQGSDVRTHAVCAIACDVGDYSAVQNAVAEANSFHQRITDHVVCNAGTVLPGLFLEQDVALFRSIMETNFFGALHTVKAALPAMVNNPLPKGEPARRVVFVSSAAALTTFIGYAQYSSSKYALRGLSDALRNELQLYGIETTIYYPGNIDTPSFAEEQKHKPEETKAIDGVTGAASPEIVAKTLIRGIASGHYAVTNEAILQVLRSLSNGVAPRVNTPLELILLPIFVLIQTGYLLFIDGLVKKAAKARKYE